MSDNQIENNTNQNNFIWNSDQETIRTIVPGLYEIKVGIFTDRDPRITIHLNHNVILSSVLSSHANGTVSSASTRIGSSESERRSMRGVIRHGKHPAGNVTGWTIVDFIAFPARSSIHLTYSGGSDAQGLMSLRKL